MLQSTFSHVSPRPLLAAAWDLRSAFPFRSEFLALLQQTQQTSTTTTEKNPTRQQEPDRCVTSQSTKLGCARLQKVFTAFCFNN